MEERLQKVLSAAGICSRRGAEPLLEAGRVTVNGRPARVGDKADPERDRIEVDGVPVTTGGERIYLLLHKPAGVVTTLSDERGRPTVAALVENCGIRVWPVGRLDQDSEGLLLLSNDGDFTYRMTHPSHEIDKEYHVTVKGDAVAALPILESMTNLDGGDSRRKEPAGAPYVCRCRIRGAAPGSGARGTADVGLPGSRRMAPPDR